MSGLDISNNIVAFLKNKLNIIVKATPQAIYAPTIYEMNEAQSVVLVWHDSTPSFSNSYLELNHHKGISGFKSEVSREKKRMVVSVGLRSPLDLPDIDSIVDNIQSHLTNYYIEGMSPFQIVAIQKMTIDENKTYWRQMYFDITDYLNIPIH